MKPVKLENVLGWPAGAPIESVLGTVKAVFPRKEGKKKDNTPWSVQNIILADGESEMKVSLWDTGDLVSFKGKAVSIIAGISKKDGKPCGVSVEDNTFTNKAGKEVTEKIIKVTDRGVLALRGMAQTEPSDNDGDLGPEETPDDDAPLAGSEPEPQVRQTATKSTDPRKPITQANIEGAEGSKIVEVRYDQTVNTGNYCNVKVGATMHVPDGVKAKDALQALRFFVEGQLPAEAVSQQGTYSTTHK